MLTKKIREHGVLLGKIEFAGQHVEIEDPNERNLVAEVSIKEPRVFNKGLSPRVVAVDCGIKNNIIRCLCERKVQVTVVPFDYDLEAHRDEYDGIFLSNGPGNPEMAQATINHLKWAITTDIPIFGICLGNQLLALAAGARTYKMKFGNRAANVPCVDLTTGQCFITSQNHGFAVDEKTLPPDWQPLFFNANDYSNEGIIHRTKKIFSSQFHPEACAGPLDTRFLFDRFIANIKGAEQPLNTPLNTNFFRLQKFRKVLILGSGGLSIGQAGEFDYSGSQAIKAMREEGLEVVLMNPNIATVQTSKNLADKVYFLPVTPSFVIRVIEKEKPDCMLVSMGGQTALNVGIKLFESGELARHNVHVLGTPIQTVIDTEDRELFKERLDEINEKLALSYPATSVEEAIEVAEKIGYPVLVRSAFALGGLGSGFAENREELVELVSRSFTCSDQLLIDKDLRGWKEIEYEVVRDSYDNCVTVCNMENFDPLGIHTGESIVIAPSQTLSNTDYHKLRELAIRIIRHIGIVGECNVQYAYDPQSEDYRVIEVNARLSRSSALASKATGYPLAFVAAKLGLGYGLFELKNSVTKTTSAFFEPALDYVVCKIPRWDLGKFHGVDKELGSSMKSVGEVMAIGRTFEEAIQKGLRMIGQGMHGFVENKELVIPDIDKALREPTDKRIFVISKAFRAGYTVDQVHELTKIDRWFLEQLMNIMQTSKELHAWGANHKQLTDLPDTLLYKAKRQGFSDFQVARAIGMEGEMEDAIVTMRQHRKQRGILPVVKQIDTLAAEYPAQTNYLYLTYSGTENDVHYLGDRKSIVVLGSGAYRIGSSVEFDWCGVQALNTIRKEGYRSVMINYNPETVSTDYDMCDRLYFDELTFERVMDILDLENPHGVIVSTGGQIPNNLAMRLDAQQVPILGTSAKSIDNAEDRDKFSAMLDRIGVDQPEWSALTSMEDINAFVEKVGFPVLVRPSYVLSGAAMNVCSNQEELERFLQLAANVSQKHPVVVSQFIEHAKEVEMDAVAKDGEIIAYAISEHIEFAGVHSGDATIQFPPQKLYVETVRRIKRISREIARELKISGPFNIQFLARDNDIKVIECNLRASRSFPFVSKVLKINLIELATKIMLGIPVEKPDKNLFDLDYVGIKASQFSFNRLQKADPVLGVDMASTGEVGCLGDDTNCAILKAMLSVGQRIPERNILLSTGGPKQKVEMLQAARQLQRKGYKLFATGGTSKFLTENGVENTLVYWPSEEGQPQALDMLHRKEIDMVVNIPKNLSAGELTNGYKIRRAAIDLNIPLITNARLASAFINAFCTMSVDDLAIKSWAEYC